MLAHDDLANPRPGSRGGPVETLAVGVEPNVAPGSFRVETLPELKAVLERRRHAEV